MDGRTGGWMDVVGYYEGVGMPFDELGMGSF